MAERFQKTIDRDESKIPKQILNNLLPFYDKIDDILRIPLHFAHSPLHTAEVMCIGRQIAESVNLRQFVKKPKFNIDELERFDLGAYCHDLGYAFVEEVKILKPDEHHYGSWFIARSLGMPTEVCWGVLKHINDKLSEKDPWWLWTLVASDRLAGMGYSGILREASLAGVKHPLFKNPLSCPEKIVDLRDLAEVGYKTKSRMKWEFPAHAVEELSETNYEANVRRFFETEILPILTSQQKKQLMDKVDILLERYDGDIDGKISGILDEGQMYEFKWFNTVQIYETLRLRK